MYIRPRPMVRMPPVRLTLNASGVVRGTTATPAIPGFGPFAREVGGSGREPPLQDLHELVPVRVQQQATLLQNDSGVIAARIEPHPAQVCTHRFVPCPTSMVKITDRCRKNLRFP